MQPAAKSPRNALLAKYHAMAKEAGLDEDTRRDMLERVTGHRSAKDCSDAQLISVIELSHVKQNTNKSYTAKVMALYLAAYNLGGLADATDGAISAFVQRQTGKASLAFVTSADANAVSEALKAICARYGFDASGDGMTARRALLMAQWKRLADLKEIRLAVPEALDSYVSRKYLGHRGYVTHMTEGQLDNCARAFGRRIRAAMRNQPGAAST